MQGKSLADLGKQLDAEISGFNLIHENAYGSIKDAQVARMIGFPMQLQ